MNPSALESASRTFETSLDFWGAWLLAATLCVVIGLVLEYWHQVSDFIEQVRRPAAAFPLQTAVGMLGAILITLGVAGELFFTYMASRAETNLRINNNQMVALLNGRASQNEKDAAQARKDAEIAREQSAHANERAAQAEQHAAQENARAAKALKAAEVARKNAEGFRLQIAEANERAANAERETARLTQRVADRTLTDAQAASIAEKIKLFAGQRVQIMTYWDASEPLALANRILLALNLAKWKYLPPPEHTILIGGLTGIQVFTHPEADVQTRNAAASLTAALNEQGIIAAPKLDTAYPKNQIMINVGAKP